jgi:hypothetical protein
VGISSGAAALQIRREQKWDLLKLDEGELTSWKNAQEPYTWITPPPPLLTPG